MMGLNLEQCRRDVEAAIARGAIVIHQPVPEPVRKPRRDRFGPHYYTDAERAKLKSLRVLRRRAQRLGKDPWRYKMEIDTIVMLSEARHKQSIDSQDQSAYAR